MHIPDGLLSTPVAVAGEVGGIGLIGYAAYWVKTQLSQRRVVLMAVLGALIFALQMLNFPVAGGTSGHFGGGALAGIALGFWPATLVLSAVLGIQALVFSDGGVLAFGMNVINMGVIAPAFALLLYRGALRISDSRGSRVAGAFAGAFAGVVASSAAVAFELWVSGRANFGVALVSMVGWHALIGIGEGLITGALVGYLAAVRPDLLGDKKDGVSTSMNAVYIVLGVLAVIGAGISWLASSHPDGLEFVLESKGISFPEFSLLGNGTWFADYGVRGLGDSPIGTVLAGIVGLVLVGALLWVLFASKKRERAKS
ncbi:MAG: energy-coupling factor ABC transporter permease [Actinomycetes bacterium]|jgi:cobalt/nickel transport system permease protein|nr:energy-coupling factor ABC transporter permease [Actinomycetes bacterium]